MSDKTQLAKWRKSKIVQCKEFPPYLLYLSKKENFESIIKNGILPQNETKKKGNFSPLKFEKKELLLLCTKSFCILVISSK